MTGQTTWTRGLTRALVALVLTGLFAMHGLPDAMATTSSGVAAAGMPASGMFASSSNDDQTHVRHVGDRSASLHGRQHRDAPVARMHSVLGTPAAMPGSCGLDHAGCVAVLRDTPGTDAPAVLSAIAFSMATSTHTGLRHSVVDSRAPPEVSLVELGISRT